MDRKNNMQNCGHKTTKKKWPSGRQKMKGTHEDAPNGHKMPGQDNTTEPTLHTMAWFWITATSVGSYYPWNAQKLSCISHNI